MKKASDKAYISKRLIEKYQKEKEKQMNGILESIKEVKEDEQMQESLALKQENLDLLGKVEIGQNKKPEIGQNESDSDASAEEVDSDDLGEDITQKRQPQPQQMMPPQFQQMINQPQQQPPFNAMMMNNKYSNINMNLNLIGSQPQPQNMMQMQQQQPQQKIQSMSNSKNQINKKMQQSKKSFQEDATQKRQKLQQIPPQQQMQQQIGIQPQQQMFQPQNQMLIQPQQQMQSLIQPQQQMYQQLQPTPFNNQIQSIPGLQALQQQQLQQQPQNYYQPQIQLDQPQQQPYFGMQPQQQVQQPTNKKYRQKVDTNVFQVSMSCLKTETEVATGDPMYCESCKGILNTYSVIEEKKETNEQVWICEFCNNKNKVSIEPEEKPKTDTTNYILEAAPMKEEQKTTKKEGEESKKAVQNDDISIVYCIDISGSMGFRSQGAGPRLLATSNQVPTRLQCVKETLSGQIKEMKESHPERKLGIVTFTDSIEIYGDGDKYAQVKGKELEDYNFLLKNGKSCADTQMRKPLKNSYQSIENKLQNLTPQGSTALGPGLLTAIAMAGEGSPGSQVIVCTDGISNLGLGALSRPQFMEQATEFYKQCGEYAKSKGVTVHIVTIIGQDCNIDAISSVSEMTNGEIERVDPMEISKNFKEFLAKPVLATKVQLKVKLHKGLEFRNEAEANLNADKTILTKEIGNANEDTEITFEYKLKKVSELVKMDDLDLLKITHLHFQAQIFYTALDGARCVRVITQRMEISSDKEELEKKADYEVLGINAIQQSSKLARQGDVKAAQINAKAWDKRLSSNIASNIQSVQHNNFRSNINGIYNMMYQAQQPMMQQQPQMQQLAGKMQSQPQQQRQQFSDAMSQQFYKNSRINKSNFNQQPQ